MSQYVVSEKELKLIKDQAARRALFRAEFLKQRTNPWKHASEAGYVFDPALQRFMSMKACQLDHFQANPRTSLFGIFAVIAPMVIYGYIVWNHRNNREQQIRCGELRYKERIFKFQ